MLVLQTNAYFVVRSYLQDCREYLQGWANGVHRAGFHAFFVAALTDY